MKTAWNKGNRKYSGICPTCGIPWASFYKRKYCSSDCYHSSTEFSERISNLRKSQKGKARKPFVLDHGYKKILVPDHPYANKQGYVFEHRLVVEKYLNRYLDPKEIVHHLDGNITNNDIDNLIVTTRQEHGKYHNWAGFLPDWHERVRGEGGRFVG